MPKIFLSHSSRDSRQAIALRQWLIEQNPPLANEIFVDLHRDTGTRPIVQWTDALRQASARCEAVICLLSANWEASPECATEYRFAEYLNKRVFSVCIGSLIREDPTRGWEKIDLYGAGPTTEIDIADGGEPVAFLSEGLYRLKEGIVGAGVGPESFVWPPPPPKERLSRLVGRITFPGNDFRRRKSFIDLSATARFGRSISTTSVAIELDRPLIAAIYTFGMTQIS